MLIWFTVQHKYKIVYALAAELYTSFHKTWTIMIKSNVARVDTSFASSTSKLWHSLMQGYSTIFCVGPVTKVEIC